MSSLARRLRQRSVCMMHFRSTGSASSSPSNRRRFNSQRRSWTTSRHCATMSRSCASNSRKAGASRLISSARLDRNARISATSPPLACTPAYRSNRRTNQVSTFNSCGLNEHSFISAVSPLALRISFSTVNSFANQRPSKSASLTYDDANSLINALSPSLSRSPHCFSISSHTQFYPRSCGLHPQTHINSVVKMSSIQSFYSSKSCRKRLHSKSKLLSSQLLRRQDKQLWPFFPLISPSDSRSPSIHRSSHPRNYGWKRSSMWVMVSPSNLVFAVESAIYLSFYSRDAYMNFVARSQSCSASCSHSYSTTSYFGLDYWWFIIKSEKSAVKCFVISMHTNSSAINCDFMNINAK